MKKTLPALLLIPFFGVVAAEIAGHRIYGKPTVVDNRPLLMNPLLIRVLEEPNIVVTATGKRLTVEGVIFEKWAITASPEELSKLFLDSNPIRVEPDETRPSKVAFESRITYFCGNTFRSAKLFPRSLPSYRLADFGHGLIQRGLAHKNS